MKNKIKKTLKKRMRNANKRRNKVRVTKKMTGGVGSILWDQYGQNRVVSPDQVSRMFKNTEANHDLEFEVKRNQRTDFITKDINESPMFNKHVLDSRNDTPLPPHTRLLNDLNIVREITQKTKEEWSQIHEGQIQIQHSMYTQDGSDDHPVVMKKSKPYDFSLFNKIISEFTDGGQVDIDIFLIIDVGSDLISELKTKSHYNHKFHLNYLHSIFTLADSARKKKPTDKNFYESSVINKTKIYSWHDLYEYPIISPRTSLLLSDYMIRSKKDNDTWNVAQYWEAAVDGAVGGYQTFNARVENNKSTIFKELMKEMELTGHETKDTSKILNRTLNDDSNIDLPSVKRHLTIPIERKRSGDYLQIEYAKRFPRIMAKILRKKKENDKFDTDAFDRQFQILFGGTKHVSSHISMRNEFVERMRNNFSLLKDNDAYGGSLKKFIRKRTYFVTIDWPAVCYCIFNKINVLFLNRRLKYTISISF